jgi:hypothetical protein
VEEENKIIKDFEKIYSNRGKAAVLLAASGIIITSAILITPELTSSNIIEFETGLTVLKSSAALSASSYIAGLGIFIGEHFRKRPLNLIENIPMFELPKPTPLKSSLEIPDKTFQKLGYWMTQKDFS